MTLDGPEKATHVIAVNLDYRASGVVSLVAPGSLEIFDASGGAWSSTAASRVKLGLPPGGGKLLRVQ